MKPILYILMRLDMDSMNPGKAMTQASHATSLFTEEANEYLNTVRDGATVLSSLLRQWKEETSQHFGTCIVLGVPTEKKMQDIHNSLFEYLSDDECLAGIVNDPSYPIRDGQVVHHLSVNTCSYVFCDIDDTHITRKFSDLTLHP